jgi:phage protein D/phage baseplate assembly protein gpV
VPADQVHSGRPKVKIDGQELAEEQSVLIDTLVIDDHLQLPDQLTIIWRDPARDVLEKVRARIGSPIEVGVVATGRGAATGDALFKGEITGLEGDYGVGGQRVVLRAYDLSHRLHRGRRTEAYKNKKDSDIARQLAADAGLQVATVDDSRTVHEHVSQINLTDWEFLKARAREIGFEVGVNDGKFNFRRAVVNQGAPGAGDLDAQGALQLAFGSDLMEFRPRVSASAQVKEVVARGWNYLDKQPVIGRDTTSACNSAPQVPDKPDVVAGKFPTKPFTVTDRVLTTQSEADAAAAGMAHQISAALGEADGIARGNARIRAGAALTVSLVAPPFAGTWTVTNSRHVFEQSGYKTVFSVAGRQERSVLGLASVGATSGVGSAGGPPIYGLVVGLVTNVKDPDDLSRIKLKFPWLSDSYETDWVRLMMPGGGKDRGFMWLPEVDDEVLVAFEQGDVRRPYAIGALFNGKDKWSVGGSQVDGSGEVARRGLSSKAEHTLGFHEISGKQGVFLRTGDKKLKIKLDQTGTEITVHSDGKVTIKGREILVDAQQKLELKAGSEVSIQAPQVKIAGQATVDIDGGMITLN